MKRFKHGDYVTWTSEAAGTVRTKLGIISEVLPAGVRPNRADSGMQRDHESYLVRASVIDGSAAQLRRSTTYWPRVSKLSLAEESLIERVKNKRDHARR